MDQCVIVWGTLAHEICGASSLDKSLLKVPMCRISTAMSDLFRALVKDSTQVIHI